jgi:hypothetical protein
MKSLTLIGLFLFLTGCGNYKNIKSQDPLANKEVDLLIDKSQIDFTLIKKEILQPHCISCHKGTHKLYDQYNVVKSSQYLILDRIKNLDVSLRMPPQKEGYPALNQRLIQLYTAWVEAGAPENAKVTPNPPLEEIPLISFLEIKEKLLIPNNCIGCHSHFNDYSVVQGKLSSIENQITDNKMPFPKRKNMTVEPVSQQGKTLLLQWIVQGAPEFSDQKPKPLKKPELKPTWISLRNNVFGPKCILCHNSFGPRGPHSLASYGEIRDWFMKQPDLFNYQTPDSSYFIGAILGTNPDSFGIEMPLNSEKDDLTIEIPKLTDEEMQTIYKWIELKLPIGDEL